MQGTARNIVQSRAARIAGRVAGILSAAAEAAAAVIQGAIRPEPVLQPIPVRVRRSRTPTAR